MTPNPNPHPWVASILVVEDEVLVRVVVADELRALGLSVLEASSADEALSYFSAGVNVDLVFTDIQLPGSSLDGLQMAHRLRTEYPSLPIVLTSGNHGFLGRPGVELFVPKPYEVTSVVKFIVDLLTDENGSGDE
jgi:CheY-like chemotaxis protein